MLFGPGHFKASYNEIIAHMLVLLSPAKTMNFHSVLPDVEATEPPLESFSKPIVAALRRYSPQRLSSLMNISHELAVVNVERYKNWAALASPENSRPAVFAFAGEVYRGLQAGRFDADDLAYAQKHLRILSALHGVLRPLDQIQPHRLEMQCALTIGESKNLYRYWRTLITSNLKEALSQHSSRIVLNLASAEYAKAVNFSELEAEIITPQFFDLKDGRYKQVSAWAKQARGAMASFVVRRRVESPAELINFPLYQLDESAPGQWIFKRDTPWQEGSLTTEQDDEDE